jgi:hypothetical protein
LAAQNLKRPKKFSNETLQVKKSTFFRSLFSLWVSIKSSLNADRG